jgi:Derlin-2/3
MDQLMGGDDFNAGGFPLEQWFYEMPVCTRWWTTATVATSVLVQCEIITPFQLFYSFNTVFMRNQVRHIVAPSTSVLSISFCITEDSRSCQDRY